MFKFELVSHICIYMYTLTKKVLFFNPRINNNKIYVYIFLNKICMFNDTSEDNQNEEKKYTLSYFIHFLFYFL